MHLFPHRYEVKLAGGAHGYAELSTIGAPPLATAPPLQFDGPGDAWSPEHLLLASVQACFLFTLRAIARKRSVAFHSLELDAVGTVHRLAGVTRFAEIVLRPTIRIDAGVGQEVVTQLLSETAKACLVSASLATPIRIYPDVVRVPDADEPNSKMNGAPATEVRPTG